MPTCTCIHNAPLEAESEGDRVIHYQNCELKLPNESCENGSSNGFHADGEMLEKIRYPDGSVRLRNPNIELMDQDILYHLALGSGSHDLVEMFGDVKFVCMGGTPKRVEQFANYIMQEIGHKLPCGTTLFDISQFSYRYSMYKVGPVLSVSHGMGIPSVGILLHEIIKLMYHAKVKDPIFFRIGTCGGIGLEGGTVVISEEAVDGLLRPFLELPVLGKMVHRPSKLDKHLARELKAMSRPDQEPYDTVIGKTMCTYDFYEGQGRLDGAFCDFSENEKMEYLNKVHKAGVVNIEMESLSFASLTHHAGIKSAVVCVTLLDRLKGDQVMAPKEVLEEWQIRPQKLVSRYIKRYLQRNGRLSVEGHGSMCVKSPRRFKLVQQESETYD
ncbi:uridine phosphorylase 1 isoform X1 [Neodiprion pinetum]|uniref:Uridine phosphorylase 1 isoform X1 n=1 Tax=Neodiprion lecontei TaxID=441921 RepID=A0A6J0CCP2_NEOLC|nr:uridine phosphorylase 1 isoform X1 [Neodiprion lecontei]XP_046436414.1 uridine phosphorylase 1 isoform X1 [Neodiprion fabricii]XP_046481085.1 uridine phosphorylase 1 isoform X1 [Neodiprion pinetum]XP_046606048.1 uridine phosphorylase 1 isoform X1 [Neodiprion virginianus]